MSIEGASDVTKGGGLLVLSVGACDVTWGRPMLPGDTGERRIELLVIMRGASGVSRGGLWCYLRGLLVSMGGRVSWCYLRGRVMSPGGVRCCRARPARGGSSTCASLRIAHARQYMRENTCPRECVSSDGKDASARVRLFRSNRRVSASVSLANRTHASVEHCAERLATGVTKWW